jgi:hypothetical protein
MRISKVTVLVGDTLSQLPLSQRTLSSGGLVLINPPESLMALADEDLCMHGELQSFKGERTDEYVGYKTDEGWRDLIRSRFPNQHVECARRVTSSFEYVVVVVLTE